MVAAVAAGLLGSTVIFVYFAATSFFGTGEVVGFVIVFDVDYITADLKNASFFLSKERLHEVRIPVNDLVHLS